MRYMNFLMMMLPGLCFGQTTTYVDTFDQGVNWNGWLADGHVVEEGGPSGAYFGFEGFVAAVTGAAPLFLGDYFQRKVVSVGIDLRVFWALSYDGDEFSPVTLKLTNDLGTPDLKDDLIAYFVGGRMPSPYDRWMRYQFPIPAYSEELPTGWKLSSYYEDATFLWTDVLSHVTQIEFYFGDPAEISLDYERSIGLDNVYIITGNAELSGDLNLDGRVDCEDLNALVMGARPCPPSPEPCIGDLDGSGTIDQQDLGVAVQNYRISPVRPRTRPRR